MDIPPTTQKASLPCWGQIRNWKKLIVISFLSSKTWELQAPLESICNINISDWKLPYQLSLQNVLVYKEAKFMAGPKCPLYQPTISCCYVNVVQLNSLFLQFYHIKHNVRGIDKLPEQTKEILWLTDMESRTGKNKLRNHQPSFNFSRESTYGKVEETPSETLNVLPF